MSEDKPTLLCLHGMTLHGALMKRQMGDLVTRLESHAHLVFPDAPHLCDTERVERQYKAWRAPPPTPPYHKWWNASDDGKQYTGWEATREFIAKLLAQGEPPILLGFSQGAILATAVAALSLKGALPPIRGVILVAGAPPRAEAITPYLEPPLHLPSLHIWGEADGLMGERPLKLSELFEPSQRKTVIWPGTHVIPRRGQAAAAINDFVSSFS